MREFWDRRAGDNALFYVDSRLDYRAPDPESFWAGGREDLEKICAVLGVGFDGSEEVVEIGCGVGRLTRELAARVASVRAVDVSAEMLARARAENPGLANVEWILGDGSSLDPIADRCADACFSHVVFQHLPDPEITYGYVREMGRVLRAGGWAAFQVSNAPEIHRRRPWRERLRSIPRTVTGRAPRGQGHPAWLGSAVSIEALGEAARGAGAELERVEGAGTQWCLVLMRKRTSSRAIG